MSKTRNLSDLLDANGDVKSTALDNVALTGIDDNADAVAITIDSSENVLVGKTSSGVANVGAEFRNGSSNYALLGTASSEAPLILNRTTSDGDIIKIRKDNTAVGSIGTRFGYTRIGVSNTNLIFDGGNDRIAPSDSNLNAQDNTTTLGWSDRRFKDLYLGGSVYLGGTAAVNALDDYEEGSWTPTYNGASGGTNVGYYVKVGDIVTCYGHRWAFTSTAVSATISNFPFTSKSGVYISGTVGANTWTNNGASMWGYGSSGVYIYDCVNKVEATAIAGYPKYFSFSITYQTA